MVTAVEAADVIISVPGTSYISSINQYCFTYMYSEINLFFFSLSLHMPSLLSTLLRTDLALTGGSLPISACSISM